MTQNLLLTILLAIVLMGLVIAALSIGLLMTGKSRLRRGCGLTPVKKKPGEKKDEDTDSCSLCGNKNKCVNDERDNKTD